MVKEVTRKGKKRSNFGDGRLYNLEWHALDVIH